MSSQLSAHSAETLEALAPPPTLRAAATYVPDPTPRSDQCRGRPDPRWGSRYEDHGLLAMGGMSEVRRARDMVLGRAVAVKVLGAHLVDGDCSEKRFRREAALLATLRHPGIVDIFDYGVSENGRPYLVMPLLEGQTLARLLGQRGLLPGPPPPERLATNVAHLLAVAQAMATAHGRDLIHRDLKPSNVMVSPEGRVTVLDFGLARLAEGGEGDGASADDGPLVSGSASLQVTRYGAVQGTVLYMAPEQARGETERICIQTDVWGLGAMLCEVATGVPPFGIGEARAVLARARDHQRAEVLHRQHLPADLLELMDWCLQPNPNDRPQSAAVVARALESWVAAQERARRARRLVAESLEQFQREAAEHQTSKALRTQLDDMSLPEGPERWDIEDRIQDCLEDAAQAGAVADDKLLAAIEAAPEQREARQLLCGRLRARHARAEEAGDHRLAHRLELRLARYDDGEHSAYLAGQGSLVLWTNRPVQVLLERWTRQQHRLVPEVVRALGTTPLRSIPVRSGDYLLRLRAEDGTELACPVRVPRVTPLMVGSALKPFWVPSAADLLPGFCFVPGGPARVGGDPRAPGHPLSAQTLDVPGFCIGTYPVRVREYIAFVEDIAQTDGSDVARRLLPRLPTEVRESPTSPLVLRNGQVVCQPDRDGDVFNLDWAVPLVRHEDAEAYCHWLARRSGQDTRLPTDTEWEKAARGPFGWVYPWGTDRIDPTFAAIHPGPGLRPAPPLMHDSAFPVDTSVYGVRFLAGGVREYVARSAALVASGECVLRGGDYGAGPDRARGAMRLKNRYGRRGGATGFRVAYTPRAVATPTAD